MTNSTLARGAAQEIGAAASGRSRSRGAQVMRRLLRDRIGMTGIILVLLLILLAVLAPVIAPHDPLATNLNETFRKVGSPGHLLGTDLYGRDMLSRVIWGARPSLMIGFVATCLALGLGVTLGVISGFYAGRIDSIIMRIVDVFLAFPYLLLAIVIVGALGPGLFNATLAVAITAIPFYVRLIRGMVLSFREEQFVEASRAIGASGYHLMRHAIFPNIVPYVIVAFSINVGYLILEAASLSFLGLGAQPPSPEWGAMLAENRNYLTLAPHTVIIPGVAIFIVIIGLNLFGDALRDAFDVRLREE
jgi:peptide/nickel transport system permease protein